MRDERARFWDGARRRFLQAVAAGILGPGAARIGRGASAISAWTGLETNSVLNQARPRDKAALKIVKLDPFIIRIEGGKTDPASMGGVPSYGRAAYLLCRVETEEGLVGWGEGTNFPKVATSATELELMRPFVVGESAWDIEKIWTRLYRARQAMHGSHVQNAISCVDIALWDIVGQRLGVPLYQLLGGRVNEKIAIYTSYRWGRIPRTAEAYARRTRELVKEGALAGKWDPFFDHKDSSGVRPEDFARQVTPRTLHEVREMVRGVRQGGPTFEICVEAHAKFNTGSAIRIARMIEDLDVMFLEEPVPPEYPEAMAEVQRATTVPIAAGERIKSRLQLRPYLEQQAFRIYQPDVSRIGGITEFRKAAAMAEAYNIPVAPHNPNGPICHAAHLHICAALPNFVIYEEGRTDPAVCKEWFGAWKDSRAHFFAPEGPGLGLTLGDAAIKAKAIDLATAER